MPELGARDGVILWYDDAGEGRPLVFVHGWAMSGRVWRYQRDFFSAACRVITLDFRGHGMSASPSTGPTIDDMATDIESLLARLDLAGVILIAWSMGVSAALRAFAGIRHRIAGLVLVGGTPRFTRGDGFPHGLPAEEARGMALRLKRNYGRTMEEFFREMFAEHEVNGMQYRQIVQDIVTGARLPDRDIALRSLESLSGTDLRPLLAVVDRPTLLLHGGEDRICLPGASRFMAEMIPQAHLRVLPGIGHAPFLSRPAEFNHLVGQFVEGLYATR